MENLLKSSYEGVVFFELENFKDDRGGLIELFRNDQLMEQHYPVMAYVSQTNAGVVRGPHEHRSQCDLFAFIGPGNFKLYLWENRPGFTKVPVCEWYVVGERRPIAVIVPPGVVHAYENISDCVGWVFNAPNQLYAGPSKSYPVDEIRHENDSNSRFQIR